MWTEEGCSRVETAPPIICAERASITLHTTWTATAVLWFYILKNCQYKINCGVMKESQIHQPFHPLDATFSRSSEVSKAKVWNSETFPQKKGIRNAARFNLTIVLWCVYRIDFALGGSLIPAALSIRARGSTLVGDIVFGLLMCSLGQAL